MCLALKLLCIIHSALNRDMHDAWPTASGKEEEEEKEYSATASTANVRGMFRGSLQAGHAANACRPWMHARTAWAQMDYWLVTVVLVALYRPNRTIILFFLLMIQIFLNNHQTCASSLMLGRTGTTMSRRMVPPFYYQEVI
jgi:hypothetical protein